MLHKCCVLSGSLYTYRFECGQAKSPQARRAFFLFFCDVWALLCGARRVLPALRVLCQGEFRLPLPPSQPMARLSYAGPLGTSSEDS